MTCPRDARTVMVSTVLSRNSPYSVRCRCASRMTVNARMDFLWFASGHSKRRKRLLMTRCRIAVTLARPLVVHGHGFSPQRSTLSQNPPCHNPASSCSIRSSVMPPSDAMLCATKSLTAWTATFSNAFLVFAPRASALAFVGRLLARRAEHQPHDLANQ